MYANDIYNMDYALLDDPKLILSMFQTEMLEINTQRVELKKPTT